MGIFQINRKKAAVLGILIFLAVLSRFIFLDLRVLHHDEGVNYFFASNIVKGLGWTYNPLNYHGPIYFFVLALSFLAFGMNEFSLRLPAAVFGIILAAAPLFLRFRNEFFDNWGKYACSLFLIVSPSVMFYSRYSIHEMAYVLFCFFSIYLLAKMIEEKNIEYMPYFAMFLAFIFATKETVIIFLFGICLICAFNFRQMREIEFRDNYGTFFFSLFVFIFFYTLFFTNFFSYPQGFFKSFEAYLPWIDRGMNEIGHDKPFYYYFMLLVKYEAVLIILGILGMKRAWKSDVFGKSVVIWSASALLVYSLVSYKTPWLLVNMSVPLAFVGGYGLKFFESDRARAAAVIFAALWLGYFAWSANFAEPEGSDFAYVHTSHEVLNLVEHVDGISGKVLIVFSEADYWPLPFYFRDREVDYIIMSKVSRTDYENYLESYGVLLVDARAFDAVEAEGFISEKFLMREWIEVWVVRR